MLALQHALLTSQETPDTLSNRGIRAKEHPEYPGLWHFCYDQLEAKPGDPLVRESRGLILDANEDWRVVAAPFFRFANHGEAWADEIDWSTARVQEKVDGSLMIVWYHNGKWNVSTKGSPNAGGTVDVHPFTFAELFWRVWKDKGFDTGYMHPAYTYMFELVSPFNRVVCHYPEPNLVFLGSRSNTTLEEQVASHWKGNSTPLPMPVNEYPLNSVDQVIAAASRLTPESGEGFVVVDKHFRRVKIKSPAYVIIHHAKDGFGQRRIIDLIRLGETSEVLSYFPEYQAQYDLIAERLEELIAELEKAYEAIKDIPIQKDFAMEALKTRYSAALFQVRNGRAPSIRAGVMTANTEALERILGLKQIAI